MKIIKKIVWKLYQKISKYDEGIRNEFEYRLWKELEKRYWDIYTEKRKEKESADGDDEWLKGSAAGKVIAYQCIWNDMYDRFFYACKATGRMKEFHELKKERS